MLGGGIYISKGSVGLSSQGSQVQLIDVHVREASVSSHGTSIIPSGGGIYVESETELIFDRSDIKDCISHGNGGGIHLDGSNIRIKGKSTTDVSNNVAALNGGGISAVGGSKNVIENITISNNRAKNTGGGLLLANAVSITLRHTSVMNNVAANGGGLASKFTSGILHSGSGWGVFANKGK